MNQLSKKELKAELVKLLTHDKDSVNIGEYDVDSFLEDKIFMSASEYKGTQPIQNAIHLAIKQFENTNISITQAKAVLVNFETHVECPLKEFSEASNLVYKMFCDETDIIFGISHHDISTDFVKIILIISF